MKLNPQQAPLYGDCVVTVLLAEEDKVEDDVVFYLVFSGSTLHHCTSTRKVSSDTLETIAPGHDCCETVRVLLCASREGLPVLVVAEEDFEFVQDEAYDAAQFLATSAGNQQALNFTRFLDRSGPPSTDVDSLDEKVALAFRHLKLPAEWNVLGTDQTLHDGGRRETLMHFAVRLGLLRLTWFLLQKPGGRGALSIHNQEGATPASLALERGYHKLHRLLTEENAGEPDSWSRLSYEIPYGDCSVRHHRELDIYTLTSESQSRDEPPSPGDSCTGHIFKLRNIQQQLMKTDLKQMDSLMPLVVTAQAPSGLPSARGTDGNLLPRTAVSTDAQQLSSPPADTESSPHCPAACTHGQQLSSPPADTESSPRCPAVSTDGQQLSSPPADTESSPRCPAVCAHGPQLSSPPADTESSPRCPAVCTRGPQPSPPADTESSPRCPAVCAHGQQLSSPPADTEGSPCCRAVSTHGQQLSSPPADTESSLRCPGSTAGHIESSSDVSSVGKEEREDCTCRKKKSKAMEKRGEEAEPALAVDSGPAPRPSSCLQSVSAGGGKGTECLPSWGSRNEETGTDSAAAAADAESPSSADGGLPGVAVRHPGTAPRFSGGNLVVSSTADGSAPETAGETEHGLMNPDATSQRIVPEAGEGVRERSEGSNTSTAGALDVKGSGQPGDEARVPHCVPATRSLGADKPAESLLACSNGEASTESTADSETSRSCKESAGAPADRSPLTVVAAAKDKTADGSEPDAPLANTREAVSPADVTFSGPHKAVLPSQKSEANSSHVQSPDRDSPVCSPPGDDKLRAASACRRNTVTSSGVLAAEQHSDVVAPPGSPATGPPSMRHPPTAVCSESPQAGTATPDPGRHAQGDVGLCPLEISEKEGQGRDLKLETSLTNRLLVAPCDVVPKAEKEPVPGQVVASGRTFSLSGSPSSESVTKDDALSLVPSQKEKGTATPETHTAADCREGRVPNGPEKPPLGDTPSTALDLLPGMGNTSPIGFGGEQEGPCLSAAPKVLNIEEGTDSSLRHVSKAPVASDSSLTEEGKNLVLLESSAAQAQDDQVQAVICSSTKKDTLSSGALQGEQRAAPPGQEAPGVRGEPSSAACAENKALEPGTSRGTPSACLNAETKHNEEVAPPFSLRTEGGAAQSPVPPGASVAADSSQGAVGAEHSRSPVPPAPLPEASDASEPPRCNGPFALDVGVKNTQSQGKGAALEVSGDVPVGVPVVDALQGAAGARRKGLPRSARDPPTPEVSLSREKNMVVSLPGALPDKGVTDPQGAAPPDMVPLGWETGRLEGADRSCGMGDGEEAPVDGDARPVPLQTAAGELPAETGRSAGDDEAPSRDGGGPPPPCTVSAEAGQLPKRADAIAEAASRIVDAVIEQVRASAALFAEGETSHMPPPSPSESGPVTEQLESASAGRVIAFLPGETPQTGSIGEGAPGNLAGRSAGREEPQKGVQPVRGPQPGAEMPDTKADDEVDFLSNTREGSVPEEVAGGNTATTPKMTRQGPKTQAINRESWCTIEPCPDAASLLAPTQSPECESFLDVGLGRECAPKQGVLHREPGSDSELFHSPSEDVDSILFSKPEEEPSVCDITGSSSSTDDTASLDRHSSHGSDVSLPQISNLNRPRDQQCLNGFYSHGAGAEGRENEREPAGSGDVDEEEMDSITDVPATCSVLRGSMRSLSPFRRHSWGPGKNAASDGEMNHRSSMRVLGDVVRRPPIHRRSMSWCPSGVQYCAALSADFNYRSFSLEGLTGGAGVGNKPSSSLEVNSANAKELRHPFSGEERGDSLVSLSEEDLESGQKEHRMFGQQTCHRSKQQGFNYCTSAISSPLTKSISLMTISHPGLDTQQPLQPSRRISFSISISPRLLKSKTLFSLGSSHSSDEEEELHNSRPFHSTSANLTESITEENYNFLPQSPSKKDFEGKSGTKVSRTFSYIKNKMSSSKKSKEKEKEKEKVKEKEKDSKEKEKDKKTLNGHSFGPIPVVGPISCSQCAKPFASKDAYTCANCSAFVHKGCRESLASCAKVKMKQPKGSLQAHDTSSLPTVIMRNKSSQPKERPRSAVLLADETTAVPMFANRRSQHTVSLSKSVSIQNIAGVGNDENISNTWKFLSHSTDSLNKIVKVNESTESLTDEGTDMNEGQLMGDFELESKQLEAESWSRTVDNKFLKQQKKDVVKRQEVIYELMQTELHHVRTLKIMSDVYSRGMMTDLLFEQQMVEKLFPCLEELISIHSQFFQKILERRKDSLVDKSEKNFLIKRIGDVLVNQFSGENAERLKKTYGKFCGRHNQSVNYFKDLYTKDKRFQAFVKKKMSSAVVRRLGIPECILLVTQRITKYPVLFQRILQYSKDNEVEQADLAQSLGLVKDVIGAVDSKVASYEKKVRLNEIYTKTDSKSIMRMKSGQMFAKEDLKRKRLVRDGGVFLKNAAGRLKEVQAVLLTDILVFLQEKDQKYIFASLDQKSTVISLKKLIVREVAHEEKGLFLISMGMKDPEMVEVHASSREERSSWMQVIQDTINTLNRDEDEGIPSENEEEKKVLDSKARELKEQLQQKDQQILLLLEEKEMLFRDMAECGTPLPEDGSPTHSPRVLFRSNTEEALKGGPLMKSAINEVEILQSLVSGGLGGALGPAVSGPAEHEGAVGPVSLPRRAETFGGFDSHQMNASKGGEKEEGDDGQDLRRTESDSGLKKGGNANLAFVLKRNNEQVVQSIVHLHELLSTLQGVVSQQDSYIEDQKLMLSERALTRSSSRPSSLIEQEKQRSLEKQRQDLANLQRQQAQHLDEKRRREREWEAREGALQEREARLARREEAVRRGQQELDRDRDELQQRKAAYQCDLERLRAAQRQLQREQEQLKRDAERDAWQVSHQHTTLLRIPSFLPNPEEPPLPPAPSIAKSGSLDSELSVSPKRNSISRTHKDKGPFHILSSTSQSSKLPEGPSQSPVSTLTSSSTRLFGLAKPKDKKEKKKKNKGGRAQPGDGPASEVPTEGEEIFC